MDWSKTIFHTCQEHLDWALAEKARLDVIPVPEGKIVFLGSNPSCSSPYEDPFSHCKSANKMLTEWIPALGLTRAEVHFMNVANYKTPKNRPLKDWEVKEEIARLIKLLAGQVVVTLGETAKKAAFTCQGHATHAMFLTPPKAVIPLPHPSGRNRLLNDREWVKQMLEQSKAAIAASTGR